MQKLVGDCWGYCMLEAMLCSAERVAICRREEESVRGMGHVGREGAMRTGHARERKKEEGPAACWAAIGPLRERPTLHGKKRLCRPMGLVWPFGKEPDLSS